MIELQVEKLSVQVEGKPILDEISLHFEAGKIYGLLGRNGSGKSSFSRVLIGDPSYEVIAGDIQYQKAQQDRKSLLDLDPEDRALEGFFLLFQSPLALEGVSNFIFLNMLYNAKARYKNEKPLDNYDFQKKIRPYLEMLNMPESFLSRGVNENFSGGERKKNEILQMLLLQPEFIILDEMDSGLDVDALKLLSQKIYDYYQEKKPTILVISHYSRVFDVLKPDMFYILHEGKLVLKTDQLDVIHQIEAKGFESLVQEKSRNVHE